MLSDERHDQHIRPRRCLGNGEEIGKGLRRHPAMLGHGNPVKLRNHGGRPAKRYEGQQKETRKEFQQKAHDCASPALFCARLNRHQLRLTLMTAPPIMTTGNGQCRITNATNAAATKGR